MALIYSRVATDQGKLIFAKSQGKVREFDCWSGKILKMMKSGKILKTTKKSGIFCQWSPEIKENTSF